MTKYIIAILLFLPMTAQANQCRLTDAQRSVLEFSYSYGKEFDYGYTLAAIALKESNLGEWPINLQDPSAGFYHVTTIKVINLLGWSNTSFNHNRAASKLVYDHHLSAHLAIEELLYWRNRLGAWEASVRAYNAGNNWRSERGERYVFDIRENIARIQECNWLNK